MRSETAFHLKGEWTYHEIYNIRPFFLYSLEINFNSIFNTFQNIKKILKKYNLYYQIFI